MVHRKKGWLVLLCFILLPGCAHVISKDLRDSADPTLTFAQVLKDPDAYRGKNVVWGGEIIESLNRRDGSTLVEVFQRALNWRGEPTGKSDGRFLVTVDNYLDPYVYAKGRRITVAGEVLGEERKPLGEMDYRYPLIQSKQIYLWPVYYYAPYPYAYGPWWYYDPWWGYPYGWGWGWGFGFRYHYHRRH